MSSKTKPKTILNEFTPSNLEDFIEWSRKNRFGYDQSNKDMLESLGIEGEKIVRRLFEVSQNYETFRYRHYAGLIDAASCLMQDDCVEEFFNTPLRIQPDLLEIARVRGSLNLKGYLKVLKLAKYPKPCVMAGHITLKSLMLSTLGLAGRDTAAKISKKFKLSVNDFAGSQGGSKSHIIRTSLFVLYTVYGENSILEILERSKNDQIVLTVFEIVSLLEDWSNLREYPLEWAVALVKDSSISKDTE